MGVAADDQEGVNEKNKQFVGDLLFGQSHKDPANGVAGSIVDTFRVNRGYQILGKGLSIGLQGLSVRVWSRCQ